jgi:hypothetical protein
MNVAALGLPPLGQAIDDEQFELRHRLIVVALACASVDTGSGSDHFALEDPLLG